LPQAVAQVAAQGAWGVLIRALTCTQVREVVVGLGAPAVPALIKALGDSDSAVRRAAAEALGKLGDPQAVPALIQALGDSDSAVRRAAAEALGAIGDPQAVPALIQALGDSDWDVRRAAAWALGKLGDPQAVPALSVWAHAGGYAARDALQTLGHPMLDLPQAVTQVAAQGAWGVLIRALTCTQVREVVVGLGAPAVPALIQALGDGSENFRWAAAWALGAIGDPQAIPALIQALGDSDRDVRRAAAWALGAIGDPQAVPALIQALGDSDWDVRHAARQAIQQIETKQSQTKRP
jgi:HEAT repeat protein